MHFQTYLKMYNKKLTLDISTYCPDKLYRAMFNEYSMSGVKIVTDRYNNKTTRLLVTSIYNQKIGLANFDISIHNIGNECSKHFMSVYQ